jgi:hypothetical protein
MLSLASSAPAFCAAPLGSSPEAFGAAARGLHADLTGASGAATHGAHAAPFAPSAPETRVSASELSAEGGATAVAAPTAPLSPLAQAQGASCARAEDSAPPSPYAAAQPMAAAPAPPAAAPPVVLNREGVALHPFPAVQHAGAASDAGALEGPWLGLLHPGFQLRPAVSPAYLGYALAACAAELAAGGAPVALEAQAWCCPKEAGGTRLAFASLAPRKLQLPAEEAREAARFLQALRDRFLGPHGVEVSGSVTLQHGGGGGAKARSALRVRGGVFKLSAR